MLTYIEKHTVVTKDTLNVDHNSRETYQQVKFMNPDNYYNGTFTSSQVIFEDEITKKRYNVLFVAGNAVVSGDTGLTSLLDSAKIKDELSPAAVSALYAIPSMKLLSSVASSLSDDVADLAGKAVMLSGGNEISGKNSVQDLNVSSLNVYDGYATALSVSQLSAPTLNDIIVDGTTLSSIISGASASISALEEQLQQTSASLDGKIDATASEISDSLSAGLSVELSVNTAPTPGCLTTYTLYQGGVSLGSIDIPKDVFILSGSIETVTEKDVPYPGAKVGDKYIDLVLNTDDLPQEYQHIYIPVTDLVDTYEGSVGDTATVYVTEDHQISAEVNKGGISAEQIADGAIDASKLSADVISMLSNKQDMISAFGILSGDGNGNITSAEISLDGYATEDWVNEHKSAVSVDNVLSDINILHVSNDEYARMLVDGSIQQNWLYVVSGDNVDVFGEQIKNVAPATDLSDAVNYQQLLSGLSTKQDMISANGILSCDGNGNITSAEISLDGYATEDWVNEHKSAVSVDNQLADINVFHIDVEDYAQLLVDGKILSNWLYVVSGDYIDAYGEQIKNAAPATDLSDAVNYQQLLSGLSAKQDMISANGILSADGNGNVVSAEISQTDLMQYVTWAELAALKASSKLVPGQQYRITDYVATSRLGNARSAGNSFDLIVVADSAEKLNELARAARNEADSYFPLSTMFEQWQVWYSLENDYSRFSWAQTNGNGKGVIYRLVDEFGNDVPYDFKGLQLFDGKSAYLYTFDKYELDATDSSLNGSAAGNKVYNNKIAAAHGSDGKAVLNFNIFEGVGCYSNVLGADCTDNFFKSNCCANTFGAKCTFNSFGNSCFGNVLGANCVQNQLADMCQFSRLGANCQYNALAAVRSQNIVFENSISQTVLSCSAARSDNDSYRNVTVAAGISNKTINDQNVNQTFKTTYQPANSQVISI